MLDYLILKRQIESIQNDTMSTSYQAMDWSKSDHVGHATIYMHLSESVYYMD